MALSALFVGLVYYTLIRKRKNREKKVVPLTPAEGSPTPLSNEVENLSFRSTINSSASGGSTRRELIDKFRNRKNRESVIRDY